MVALFFGFIALGSDASITFEGRNDLAWRVLGPEGPVCEATPCAVSVPAGVRQRFLFARTDALLAKQWVNPRPGERLTLEARRGNKALWLVGSSMLLATGAGVTILGSYESTAGTSAGVVPYAAIVGVGLTGIPMVVLGSAKVRVRRDAAR